MYPLLATWTQQYARHVADDVHITVAATGSGAGIAQAIAGAVQFGASDAYMTDEQIAASTRHAEYSRSRFHRSWSPTICPASTAAAIKLDGPDARGRVHRLDPDRGTMRRSLR
jgi:phosphate transport system substrate-binding protein